MKKIFVYYFRDKKYSDPVVDFLEYLESSIPKEDLLFIDQVNKKPSELRSQILKDYGFASGLINNPTHFNSPIIVAIESSFSNTFTGKEAIIKDDVIPAIKTQIITPLYPPVTNPDTGSGSGSSSGSSGGSSGGPVTPVKKSNWGLILGGAAVLGILLLSKKSRK